VGPIAVTGPMTDAEFSAHLPLGVTGPLTDAQLAARLPLSVSAQQATSPWVVGDGGGSLTVDGSLTVPGVATDATLDAVRRAMNDVALTAILEREKLDE